MIIGCIGDSHTRFFEETKSAVYSGVKERYEPTVITRVIVSASAKGLSNGATSRLAYRAAEQYIKQQDISWLCFNFGLVDAEVGYYYRRYVENSPLSAEEDFSSYFGLYVQKAIELAGTAELVFKGINPSCVCSERGNHINAYGSLVKRISNQPERKRILNNIDSDTDFSLKRHFEINCVAAKVLKREVDKAGFPYFDLRKEVTNKNIEGSVDKRFLPDNGDIHMVSSMEVNILHRTALLKAFGQIKDL